MDNIYENRVKLAQFVVEDMSRWDLEQFVIEILIESYKQDNEVFLDDLEKYNDR